QHLEVLHRPAARRHADDHERDRERGERAPRDAFDGLSADNREHDPRNEAEIEARVHRGLPPRSPTDIVHATIEPTVTMGLASGGGLRGWAKGSRESGGTISGISARLADALTTRTTVSSVRAGTADDAYGAGGVGGGTGRRAHRGVRRPRRCRAEHPRRGRQI